MIIQIMISNAQLDLLHQSAHFLSDGTFAYRPMDIQCAQLYLLFAMYESECQLAAQALMPDRTEASYVTFFGFIRQQLETRFQTIGNIAGGVFHMDNEAAAYNAATTVFHEARLRTCSFHYAQAILNHVKSCGLKALYEQSPIRGYNVAPFNEFKRYVRNLFALMMLPADIVRPAWDTNFRIAPNMNDANLNRKLQDFVNYYQRQWLATPDRIQRWNHFDNSGPRTTNYCEAHNSSLASKFQVIIDRLINLISIEPVEF